MTLSKPVVVLFVVGCSMCFAGEQETITHSVLNVAEPMLIDHGPVIIQRSRDSVLDIPFSSEFQTAPAAIPVAPVPLGGVEVLQKLPTTIPPIQPTILCQKCECTTCCCKPSKVEATICLVDPAGCTHEICTQVPACCAGHAPKVSWKSRRILGRKVAMLCWDCCDHEVKVVVTRRGKVRVHD